MTNLRQRLPRVRYFFDNEFFEDGRTIELISIGIVCADGREYYACSNEFHPNGGRQWLRYLAWSEETGDRWLLDNVFPQLPLPTSPLWKDRDRIREDILAFVAGTTPEWWAYFADYDWIVLCQLFGRMIDLPRGWPKLCFDLKQEQVRTRVELPKQTVGEHNALCDARWLRDACDMVFSREVGRDLSVL